MVKFNYLDFSTPDAFFWPGYVWFWNDHLSEEKIMAQLGDMNAVGAKSVWIIPVPKDFRPNSMPTDMQPDYLSEDYLKLFAKMVEEMRNLNMRLWLYDEGGWPSGSVCGRIVRNNPDLAQQSLRRQSIKTSRGQIVKIPENCLSAFLLSRNNPMTRLKAGSQVMIPTDGLEIELYDVEYMKTPTPGRPLFPDLLNIRTTQEFIRLTHEAYKKAVGQHFGTVVPIIISDDVKAASLPWTDDLSDSYEKEKGYDLREKLSSLFKGSTREDRQVRVDYYEWWTNRFAEAFFGQIQTWCAENHLLFAGHVGGEEDILGTRFYGHGHVLRNFRRFDIPGVDAVWRQIFPIEKREKPIGKDQPLLNQHEVKNNHFPKYASTVAHQEGKRFSFIELFSVYGTGLSLDQMKWITDFSYVRGINLTTLCETYLSTRDFYLGAMRPMFFPGNPLWKYLSLYHGYTARLSYLMSLGTPDISAAVYYPIRDIWAAETEALKPLNDSLERLADILFSNRCDFDFIDDDVLERETTKVKDGALLVGPMNYRTVFIAETEWMTQRSKDKLQRFISAGGKVFRLDRSENKIEGSIFLEWKDLENVLTPLVCVEPKHCGIRACKLRLENGNLYLITNENITEVHTTLKFAENLPMFRLDPDTARCWKPGEARRSEGTWSLPLNLKYGESCVFLFSPDAIPAVSEPCLKPGKLIRSLTHSWMCRKRKSYTIGEHDIEICDYPDDSFHPIELGDWTPRLGVEFSGDVEYEIQFECTKQEAEKSLYLELGVVKYACEVVLNDVSLGRRAWVPFRFPVQGILREGLNTVKVVVTNTLANQYVTTRMLDRWPEKVIGGYHKIALEFEREAIPSGLFGPVEILG